MVQAQLIKWAIVLAVIGGTVGSIWWKIHSLTSQRDHAIMEVSELTGKLNRLELQFEEATRTTAELTTQMQSAKSARDAIQVQLQSTLSKLRQQKPPQECKAAIDWAVQQKLDLDWDKKPGETQ